MDPFVERPGDHRVGGDDVEALETGQPGQEVPVGGKKAMRSTRAIADRHHDVPPRTGGRRLDEHASECVFVDPCALLAATLETAEGADEKARLPEQPLGAAVVGGAGFQGAEREALERVDRFSISPEGVVQAQNLRDESRAQVEWGLGPFVSGGATRGAQQHFALGGRQHSGVRRQALGEARVQLVPRHQVWQEHGVGRGR